MDNINLTLIFSLGILGILFAVFVAKDASRRGMDGVEWFLGGCSFR